MLQTDPAPVAALRNPPLPMPLHVPESPVSLLRSDKWHLPDNVSHVRPGSLYPSPVSDVPPSQNPEYHLPYILRSHLLIPIPSLYGSPALLLLDIRSAPHWHRSYHPNTHHPDTARFQELSPLHPHAGSVPRQRPRRCSLWPEDLPETSLLRAGSPR